MNVSKGIYLDWLKVFQPHTAGKARPASCQAQVFQSPRDPLPAACEGGQTSQMIVVNSPVDSSGLLSCQELTAITLGVYCYRVRS